MIYDEEHEQEPEETDATESTKNVISVTFDLESWLHGDTVLNRIEERLISALVDKYHKDVENSIDKSVENLVHEKVAEKIDTVVEKRLNAPVVKKNWEGEITEETPMIDYLSDQFTKHLKANERRYDDAPRFEKWVSDEVIKGLDKLTKDTLAELRKEAEAAVRTKVQELLADYISEHWKPHPLPPLLDKNK